MLQQLISTPASTEDAAKLFEDTSGSEREEGGRHYFMRNRAKAVSIAVNDPEYQRASLVDRRLGVVESLPDVAEALGLTRDEVNRLFDLFAHKILRKDIASGGFGSISDDALFQWDESLAALLGPARQAPWLEYQQTRDFRMHVRNMGYQLAEAGVPLSEMQRRAMTPAVIAEQKRLQQEREELERTYDRQNPTGDPKIEEQFSRFADALSRNPIDAAVPYLGRATSCSAAERRIAENHGSGHGSHTAGSRQRRGEDSLAGFAAATSGPPLGFDSAHPAA
jgi:hypothetical protein